MHTLRAVSAVVLLVAAAAHLTPNQCSALPPNPQLDVWNEGPVPDQLKGETNAAFEARIKAWIQKWQNRTVWNCYNYAVGVQTTAGGGAVRAHPGRGQAWPNLSKGITAADMCTKARNRAIADGLHAVAWTPGNPIPTPPAGENLVALGMLAGDKGDGADYHWWRLNGDGTWSHKRGSTEAKATYTDDMDNEQPLTDPRQAAQRDGYDLCGFMSVPKLAVPNIGSLAALPACTPRTGSVHIREVGPSGDDGTQKMLPLSGIGPLIGHLPSLGLTNQVPDPQWTPLPAGQSVGFIVTAGVDGIGGVPPYMRVQGGIVQVVRAWPDTSGPLFYRDNNGLEPFLVETVVQQTPVSCQVGTSITLLTACECSDMALGASGPLPDAPAASPWVMSAIAAFLSVTGVWFVRKQPARSGAPPAA